MTDTLLDMETNHCWWMAALVDGEGSIIRRQRPGRSRIQYALVVANDCVPILEFAQEVCGAGRIYDSNRLRIERRDDVIRVLGHIKPYLILKQTKADRAIEELGSRALAGKCGNLVVRDAE